MGGPSTNLKKIWVVNYAGHNMASVMDYVEDGIDDPFVFLTEGNTNIFETDRLRHHFDEQLSSFDPTTDALLLSGSAVLNILAVLSALALNEEVPVLIWHARGREYVRRQLRR